MRPAGWGGGRRGRAAWPLRLLAALACVAAGAGPVRATVGGPTLTEVMGYERLERKVYVLRHDHSEEGRPPELLYFDLRRGSTTGVRVPMRGRSRQAHLERIERIRKRLQPMQLATVLPIQMQVDTLYRRLLGPAWQRKPRYACRVRIWHTPGQVQRVRLTSYCEVAVRLAAVYAIPDTDRRLAVLAYRGDPTESCYEVQTPLLLGTGQVILRGVHEP